MYLHRSEYHWSKGSMRRGTEYKKHRGVKQMGCRRHRVWRTEFKGVEDCNILVKYNMDGKTTMKVKYISDTLQNIYSF